MEAVSSVSFTSRETAEKTMLSTKTEENILTTVASTDNSITNVSSHNDSSLGSPPDGCIVINYQAFEFLPWDNDDNLLSAEFELFYFRLVNGWFLPVFFLVGGPTNLINMAVFYKQGLKERINLCLFSLSLADLLFLLRNIFLYGEMMWTRFPTGERYGWLSRYIVNHSLVGFVAFVWVSQVMSAIIASERCFCILSPLHSQTVLKTRTMAIIIGTCFVVIVGLYFLVATRYLIICVFDPVTEATSFIIGSSQFYYQHQELINILDSVVYALILPVSSLVIVTVTTIITGVKLKQVVSQRAQMSTSNITPREAALTKMLICTSVLFIACVLPVALFKLVSFSVPELNSGRRYHNTYLVSLWSLDLLAYINSSFNFFVYYIMGSRYRQVFHELLCICKRPVKNKQVSETASKE